MAEELKEEKKTKKKTAEEKNMDKIKALKEEKENEKIKVKNAKEDNGESLIIKENPEEIVIDDKKMQKIEKEIQKQKSISKDEQKDMNKKVFKNIIFGVAVVLYFLSINLGFYNIKEITYLADLQVFSALTIICTIIIFEKAYKKDSDEMAVSGIEMLAVSICSLLTLFLYKEVQTKFTYIVNLVSMLFAVYFVGKSIVIYTKMKNKALRKASDIHKIIKK